ncbi:hypothetical protein FGO68_gene13825 [Halteria grandinella]|uniref:Uncharacterized protein n=1 Tax=Halteria grandinella TaxID=5974 RepID=A0A8J8NIW7_HALGN|nr:hypothetical protein FGO68_gene13825 [Halteria grandinella]
MIGLSATCYASCETLLINKMSERWIASKCETGFSLKAQRVEPCTMPALSFLKIQVTSKKGNSRQHPTQSETAAFIGGVPKSNKWKLSLINYRGTPQ